MMVHPPSLHATRQRRAFVHRLPWREQSQRCCLGCCGTLECDQRHVLGCIASLPYIKPVAFRCSDAKNDHALPSGAPGDWDAIFDGYKAAVDFPSCLVWKQLMQKYPDAKVLLTVRDPDKWCVRGGGGSSGA